MSILDLELSRRGFIGSAVTAIKEAIWSTKVKSGRSTSQKSADGSKRYPYNFYGNEDDIAALTHFAEFVPNKDSIVLERVLALRHYLILNGIRPEDYYDHKSAGQNFDILADTLNSVSPRVNSVADVLHIHVYKDEFGNNPDLHIDNFYLQLRTRDGINNPFNANITSMMRFCPMDVKYATLPNGEVIPVNTIPSDALNALLRGLRILNYPENAIGTYGIFDHRLLQLFCQFSNQLYPGQLDILFQNHFARFISPKDKLFKVNGGIPVNLVQGENASPAKMFEAIEQHIADHPWVIVASDQSIEQVMQIYPGTEPYVGPELINKVPWSDNECVDHPDWPISVPKKEN